MMTPYVNIHTHYDNHYDNNEFVEIKNIDVDSLVNVDVSHFYSVGIHPWKVESEELRDSGIEKLGDLVSRHLYDLNFLALGECGLDRACEADFEIQKEVFLKQIVLSEQIKKPLIIHAVRSYPDIISMRKETKAKQPWIIHGFQANETTVMQLLRYEGIYLSLGDVLFKNENKAQLLLRTIPLERLFLETDVAERDIKDVYERVASFLGVEMDRLRNGIFNNFVKIFGQI